MRKIVAQAHNRVHKQRSRKRVSQRSVTGTREQQQLESTVLPSKVPPPPLYMIKHIN